MFVEKMQEKQIETKRYYRRENKDLNCVQMGCSILRLL